MRTFICYSLGFLFFCNTLFATQEYDLLITGCGRSGTTFISKVLQRCGLDIQHEKMGMHGTSSWPLAVKADYVPLAGMTTRHLTPGLNQYRFKHIFHQVRDPLKCISSSAADLSVCWGFVQQHIPCMTKQDPPLVKAAKYWYYWNLEAEKIAEWTYRIEDIDEVWDEFCNRIGYKLDKKQLNKVPRNCNTRKVNHRVTWAELKSILDPDLYKKIATLARKYGYKHG